MNYPEAYSLHRYITNIIVKTLLLIVPLVFQRYRVKEPIYGQPGIFEPKIGTAPICLSTPHFTVAPTFTVARTLTMRRMKIEADASADLLAHQGDYQGAAKVSQCSMLISPSQSTNTYKITSLIDHQFPQLMIQTFPRQTNLFPNLYDLARVAG